MALQDILNAISAQADLQITEARSAHQKRLTEMREASERALAKRKQEIAQQKEQKKVQLRAKAESHAQSLKRNAILSRKQESLNELYGKVAKEMAKLPEKDTEALLRACLKKINQKGIIAPAKNHESLLRKIAPSEKFKMGSTINAVGGFIFSSETQEHDFTFEHIVAEYVRPQTELDVSKTLFSA